MADSLPVLHLISRQNKNKGTVTRYDPAKNKSKKRRTRQNNQSSNSMMSFPFPQRLNTSLRIYTVNGLIDAALAVNAKVYRPTSYFDLDSDVGGPSFAGYGTYSAMYSRYRVTSFDYDIEWCNLQSDAVMVCAYPIPSTSTPSEVAASANPETGIENNFGKKMLLGPTAATPVSRMRGHVDCRRIWGTPEVTTDNDWAGGTGTSPAVNTWLMLTAERINQAALATGVQFTLTIVSHGYWDQKVNVVS